MVEQLKTKLCLTDTVFTVTNDITKQTYERDSVVCTGFPKEYLLNSAYKKVIKASYDDITYNLFNVPPKPIILGNKDSWCSIS
jgi:uncharacterized protein YvpB